MAGSSESGARHFALNLAVLRRLFCTMAALLLFASQPLRAEPALERMSNPLRVATPGGNFSYYVAHEHSAQPRNALVVMHGHPRDAVKTLQAAIDAAQAAGAGGDTLLAARCSRCRKNSPSTAIPPVCPSRKTATPCGAAAPGSRAVWIMPGRQVRSTPWITCWPI